MQTALFIDHDDFSAERPVLGLSGGINSAALLCYLASEHPEERRPRVLLLYYAHLREHSPDTARFVFDCVRYARRHFPDVTFRMHRASMNDWCEAERFIPHPTVSPCTWHLKVERIEAFAAEHGATCDLVGFVRHERRRIKRQQERGVTKARYPIAHMSEADCFSIVEREIGWHPAIYDITDARGRRVFTHNNCLPCKNMTLPQIRAVGEHFPEHYRRAVEMAERIGNYWGRPSEYAGDPCAVCAFD